MNFQLTGFTELQNALQAGAQELAQAFSNIRYAFSQEAKFIIEETLLQAAASAGPEAFPPQYVAPMIEAAANIVVINPTDVALNFDELGTWDELTEGYHYGAKLEGGGQVTLPWTGGQSDSGLKNDVQERYEAWLRILNGEQWHGIDYSGSWTETIEARLQAWSNKAPQWLLLEYGQTEWEPTIEPYAIVETISTELFSLFEGMLASEVEYIVANINKAIPTPPSGAVYDIRGRGSRFRSLRTGRYVGG